MSGADPESILVVCTANICRSPLVELVLERGLAEVPGIRVASAGTQARTGARICHRIAQQYFDVEHYPGGVSPHRAQPLSVDLLSEASMVLTASEDVRADVERWAPHLHERLFTIREAASLGDDFAADRRASSVGLVADYAHHLDWARTVRGTSTRRFGMWPARGATGRDITEGHTGTTRSHRRTLREVAETSSVILEQLRRAAGS